MLSSLRILFMPDSFHEVYYESLRDLFSGFEVDCFMRKPIDNEDLLRKVLSVI